MLIHEAISKAGAKYPFIYRKAWVDKAVISKVVWPIAEMGHCLLRVNSPDGPAYTQWNPTMDDLTANDWERLFKANDGRGKNFLKSLL